MNFFWDFMDFGGLHSPVWQELVALTRHAEADGLGRVAALAVGHLAGVVAGVTGGHRGEEEGVGRAFLEPRAVLVPGVGQLLGMSLPPGDVAGQGGGCPLAHLGRGAGRDLCG